MTSLQRLLDGRAGRRPAPARRSPAPPPRWRPGSPTTPPCSTSPATPRRPPRSPRGPRWGSTTCGSSCSGRPSPPGNSEVKAPDGFDSADPDSPGYDWSRVDRAVSLVSAAGMRPLLVVTGRARCGPRRSPRATASATSHGPTSSGSSRARRRCATARRRRPLDHLERAQPAAVAAAAEHVQGQALHAVRAAPLPPPRAGRLPGDQDRGPDLDRALRRPGAATARTRSSRTRGRGRWPSSARWAASRSRSSAIAAGRARA